MTLLRRCDGCGAEVLMTDPQSGWLKVELMDEFWVHERLKSKGPWHVCSLDCLISFLIKKRIIKSVMT